MKVRKTGTIVVVKTVLAVSAYALLTLLVYRLLLQSNFKSSELTFAMAHFVVQGTIVIVLFLTLTTIRLAGQIREKRFTVIASRIRILLADQTFGKQRTSELAEMACRHPEIFTQLFDEVTSIVRGEARKRLGQIADEVGLTQRWIAESTRGDAEGRARVIAALGVVGNKQAIAVLLRALRDPSDAVRLEAGLALVRVGGPAETEEVFDFAVTQNRLIRILILESLRWRAQFLCDGILKRWIASGDPVRIVACLEAVAAWRVAVPLPSISQILGHSSELVRERGFRVLPYLSGAEDLEPAILNGLTDSQDRVCTAAAFAAGRLKVHDAIPLLEVRLKASTGRLSLTAAYSLAELGSEGVDVLEKTVTSGHLSSAVALEALERLRTGRFEHANL